MDKGFGVRGAGLGQDILNCGGIYRAEARGRLIEIGRVEAGSRARGGAKWVNGDGE